MGGWTFLAILTIAWSVCFLFDRACQHRERMSLRGPSEEDDEDDDDPDDGEEVVLDGEDWIDDVVTKDEGAQVAKMAAGDRK